MRRGLGFTAGLLLWLLLAVAQVVFPEERTGVDSVRITTSPRGFTFGPVQGSVRITIDNPTESFYCPKVQIEYDGLHGRVTAEHEEDCLPWEQWIAEYDRVKGFRVHPDGRTEWFVERPHRRWDYTWRVTLYAGPNQITIRLEQGKVVTVKTVSIKVLGGDEQ